MNRLITFFTLVQLLFFTSCSEQKIEIASNNGIFQMTFNTDGSIDGLYDLSASKNYLDIQKKAYLLSIRIDGKFEFPMAMERMKDIIILKFPSGTIAEISYLEKDTHCIFELTKLESESNIELITWGPYPTTISKIIGETVGVVRGEAFALGIQALNLKTLGGYPYQENDCMPEFDIFLQEDINDLNQDKKPHVLYRIEAAKPTNTGSALQAYCRNRSEDRIIANLNHDRYVAPAYEDGGVIGSKIALFGCPVEKSLETLGIIELAEGLPHPMIEGKWGKETNRANAAYMIMNFSEDNLDEALEATQKAGLDYLYHYGKSFKSWGHFELYAEVFPNGHAGLAKCVEIAKVKGIKLGLHTLSNFITTNDPYVTPVPDKRLAKVGSSILTTSIDENTTEIIIESPEFFNQFKNNTLRTVQIGDELIRYGEVSTEAPWKLLDCQRGAFETNISAHKSGAKISKLMDHGYKVFLSNTDLTIEISKNIANLYNKTGLRQISFDGLEGNKSTGLGNYGEAMMPYVWYNSLADKDDLIIDASRTTHFFWHIYSRMNWGEPWYAGFRESQTEYRLKNQPYFKRNLMPAMLGWFRMTDEISLEDMEWMLARSAAFDAGYAFITSQETLEKHGQSDQILEFIKQWERARMAGVFPENLKSKMEDISNEYHLEPIGENEWNLFPLSIGIFNHEKKILQPGEPLSSTFEFNNPYKKQSLVFSIKAIDKTVCKSISVELDNYKKVTFAVTLSDGQTLRYAGGNTASIYTKNWKLLSTIKVETESINISSGDHSFAVDCIFLEGNNSKIKFEVKTTDIPILLKK